MGFDVEEFPILTDSKIRQTINGLVHKAFDLMVFNGF